MTAQVVVIAGPAGTGKTAQVLRNYREVLGRAEPGCALWLAPNWRAVEEVRRRLLSGRGGYLAPGVMTFDQFAEGVVEFSGQQARLIDRQMQRYLIWQLVEERRKAEKFRYFAQVADTTGFVDLLAEWIREMKRLEIWPEQFRQACQARQTTDKDQELLDIYEAYQNLLTEHSLYDGEGRFWLARSLLAEGALLPPAQRQSLKLVVVDGFTDFTRTQHEILEHLARRADQMAITLPLEKDSDRKELFAKPEKTLRELRRRHGGLEVEWLARPSPPAWPALDHIERRVFANPKHYQPLPQRAERMEILAAASQLAEVELLAKRIKQLLTESEPGDGGGPVRPDDILVLFRSLEPVSVLVQEVFGRYGIPFVLESSAPLRSARSLMALVDLVRLGVEDWPLRRLLAVLSQSYFQPDWPEWQQGRAGLVADRLIRRLGASQGREKVFQALGRLIDHAEDCPVEEDMAAGGGKKTSQDDSGAADRAQTGLRRDAQTTLSLLQRLAQALDALPQQATLTGWAKAWRRLAEEVGVFRAIPRATPTASFSRGSAELGNLEPGVLEESAWEELEERLASADRLWSWVGRATPERNRE
ncbi:MAG TPA: exodeoxyribonuclease V subunit gamma, partial [Thermoguttaceae bacterium]|nr:exodeoxyribonuclease V subunit gamma [Thermoguttaceae bacterium]